MGPTKLGRTGVKHTKSKVVKLENYVHLRYNTSRGGLFRLPRGTSPMTVIRAVQHNEIVLIECIYLVSGRVTVHTGDKDVVPLKLGIFEDDNEYQLLDTGVDYYEKQ
tara:strand:+ start:6 stop:326 length:321 start_codon:yes stop_codon:yes gene_type:complete